ncbi:MAG TPA: NAD(P)/FAD-dependent oxidoreductase [Nevskiaceae bacterium]|nr:NAD(P)/FAD-dependent oxidoreductase [Nevskiaceae bacterium]
MSESEYEAIIVGAGFGGMGAAIQLQRLGYRRILMLDRADDLGGTWHLNTYPGLAVDIASLSYSYSFEPNPYWSRLYAPGREIKAYADHVARKYGLRDCLRAGTGVERAQWDERAQQWTVWPHGGAPVTARLLILATGFLSQPKKPDIPGVDSFAGKVIHTAQWDHAYDFSGKRAAMIGTGASAVQVLPKIVPQVAHMDVYQRTPIWVLPKHNPRIAPWLQKLFARVPLLQRLMRFWSNLILELVMVAGVLHNRQLPFLTRWVERGARRFLAHQVKDPELRRKLTPDYSFGCKRPTFANDYFPMFTRPNVELVTERIERIEPDAIVTAGGKRREIDTLILATGFNLWQKGNFPAFDVVGRGGVELGHWWNEHRYQSYEGITVPGFPNLFNIHSPYAYSGFCYFNTIEVAMAHMDRCLREMQRRGAVTFEVTEQAKDRYMATMRARGADTVFSAGNCASAHSYYFNQHGEATLLRLSSAWRALRSARNFPLDAYVYA